MTLVEKLLKAQKYAFSIKPLIGGFPVLAEVLSQAGVRLNRWSLPSCQAIYTFNEGSVVQQGAPLVSGTFEIPTFDREALIRGIRADQNGLLTFPDFLQATWEAGVIGYEVDLEERKVSYFGSNGEKYIETYLKAKL